MIEGLDVDVIFPKLTPREPARSRHDAAARRLDFLRACWGTLGPTQREHLTTHCQAVSTMAFRLCVAMRLPATAVQRAGLAGLFHDIGKCAIPEALLAKCGPLTATERRIINQHAVLGARYTLAITGDAGLARIVALHHHWEAAAGRTGEDSLTLQAAIVQAADALVSMTSDRPYARARTRAEALAELTRGAGEQFDGRVVRAANLLDVWGEAA